MFITNQHNANENPAEPASMSGRLRDIIPLTDTLSILSGYFYFSGIQPLVEPIAENKNLKLRILVGLDVDKKGYELAHLGDGASAQEKFKKSLQHYASSKMFDSEKCALSMQTFLAMIDEGRLQIKKTKEPNHAKLYVFEIEEKIAKGTDPIRWITGSSNLTYPGLKSQNEFNVELSNFGGKEAKEYFDEQWKNAEEITDFAGMTETIKKILVDEGVHAVVTPFEAYALILKNYLEHRSLVDETQKIDWAFSIPEDSLTHKPKYKPFSFQKDAVNQALSIVSAYNGVIVADVVGLGKSVIGSVLGCVMGAKRGLVIAPPGLVGDRIEGTGWWGYLQDFKLDIQGWEAWSRGGLEKVVEYVTKHPDFDTVIVDEAHYFRNESSIDYGLLWEICQGRRVILMTATPYSNRPSDMYALLKLFTVPKQSKLVPGGDLEATFDELQDIYRDCDLVLKQVAAPKNEKEEERVKREKRVRNALVRLEIEWPDGLPFDVPAIEKKARERLAEIAAKIRMIMEPVMIRRNRIDLRDDPQYKSEVGENLPTVNPPEEQFYQLSPEQNAFYDHVINELFGTESTFTGAIYRPGLYAKPEATATDEDEGEATGSTTNQQQENMYKFIRRLLVRRFESSFGAFAKTVGSMISIHEKVRKLSKPVSEGGKGVIILDRVMMERFCAMEDDPEADFEQALEDYEAEIEIESEKKQVYHVDTDFTKEGYAEFLKNLDADCELFLEVKKEVENLDLVANDPKAKQLCEIIAKVLTGNAGFKHHAGEPKRKVLVFSEYADTVDHLARYLKDAFPGKVAVVRQLSKETADKVRRNFDGTLEESLRKNDLDVMVATDKMSEGFNLNRAGLVINYDIPWNPTRVIQRIGRINRIGKKVFGDLYLYNYFPTDQGKDLYNIRTVAKTKVLMIHKAIGEDAQIFSTDETPEASGLFEKMGENPVDSEAMSFLTECKIVWADIESQHPEVVAKIAHLPNRVKTVAKGARSGTYLFTRKGLTLFASYMGAGAESPSYLLIKEAIEYVKCPFDEPRLAQFTEGFWERYEKLATTSGGLTTDLKAGSKSLKKKALSALQTAEGHGFEPEFVKLLAENIQQCGTLPDHILRDLNSANKQGPQKLLAYLTKLKTAIGGKLQGATTVDDEDVVIVGVDHAV